jgi:hypothetical protein
VSATITLFPEYAALIAAGVKTIETRPGPSYGTGKVPGLSVRPGERLLIHAGLRLPKPDSLWEMHQPIGDWMPVLDGLMVREQPYLQHHASGEPGAPDDIIMHPGHIVASAILRDCVPIVGRTDCKERTERVCLVAGQLTHHLALDTQPRPAHMTPAEWMERKTEFDIADQLPYGDYTPGRWAWLLDDIQPTTDRCPACWATPDRVGESAIMRHVDCPVFHFGMNPIPAKGRQGIWRWEP